MTIDPVQFILGKTVTGNIEGEIRPHVDLPRYVDLFMDGKLPLDKLISHRFSLDQVNEAFSALEKGEVIRGVVQF
jgi:S-(hydroxymethyl)glutathione dehydrogenase/alcohol dehydrogenase